MSKTIKIPLEGGFDNNTDPSVVGLGLTLQENLHNLKKGILSGRVGYGTPVEIGGGSNDKLILDIEYWPKDTTLWWLAYDRLMGQINRISEDFTTATNLSTIHQTSATQSVGTGNALVVETHEWTGTEPTTYYFKITSDATPDVFQISTDDTTYANAQNVVTSSTTVTGASGLKAYWNSTTSSALNDKWEVTVYPIPQRINITNWGNAVRFAYGLHQDASIYQYIDRKYFNDGTDFMYKPSADYHYDDKAYPRFPSTWDYEPVSATNIKGEVVSGGSLTQPRDYYYKITAIFDGSQETPLPEDYFGPLTTSSGNQGVLLKLKMDTNNFNKRITACKIYRADTSASTPDAGAYRLISTIPFTETQVSWINSTQGYVGAKVFAPTLTWDPEPIFGTGSGFAWSGQADLSGGSIASKTNTFSVPTDAKFIWGTQDFGEVVWNETIAPLYFWNDGATLLNSTGTQSEEGHESAVLRWTVEVPAHMNGTTDNVVAVYGDAGSSYDCDGGTGDCTGGSTILGIENEAGSLVASTDFREVSTCSGGGDISWGDANTSLTGVIPGADTEFSVVWYATFHISGPGECTDSHTGVNVRVNDQTVDIRKNLSYTNAYAGESVFAIVDPNIATGTGVGKIVKVNAVDYTVSNNEGDMFRVSGSAEWVGAGSTSGALIGGADVQWEDDSDDASLSATEVRLVFTDVGEIEGAFHSFAGVKSLNSKFKYSTSTGGRQYVGNVKITDSLGTSETHTDMVLFSEINQPDVIPVSNFILLNDVQGGAITGIKGLYSDIVVFAERGIFRINVPSEDPTSWSMVETEQNIGCTQPNSIVKYRGGIFFAGLDNLWYISPNFEFIPVAEAWKEEYQTALATTTEIDDTKIAVDIQNERLVVKAGSEQDKIYLMDLRSFALQKIIWYTYTEGSNEADIESFTIKNDNSFYLLNKMDAQNSTEIRELNPSSSQGTPIPKIRTGQIFINNLTDNQDTFIRRINIYVDKLSVDTSEDIEVLVRFDHSSIEAGRLTSESSLTKEYKVGSTHSSGDKFYSIRIGRRAKSIQLELNSENGQDAVIDIKGIEIEID